MKTSLPLAQPVRSEGMDYVILLSGGLDSTAALHWAREQPGARVSAVSFSYGQPNHDAELYAAQTVARRRSVPHTCLHLGEAVRGLSPLLPPPPGREGGVSRANLPGRNLIFLSCAAAHAARAGLRTAAPRSSALLRRPSPPR
jgi:7-cyano-7-deazaguanine synthase